MPYIVLALAIVIGLGLLIVGLAGADPKNVKRVFKWSAILIGGAMLVYLAATGRLILASWIAAAILPLLLRRRAFARMARGFRGPSPGQTSDIVTRYLRMQLDHDTGELRGTVLEGRFQGRLLQEMSLAEQVELLQECRVHDEQSAQILETYLDRVHGGAWRGGGESSGRESPRARSGGAMSRDEAFEVLGLAPGAGADEIREAHRKLMQKNHPDHGGSTYLAAKINQAKEQLLGG